MAILEVYHGCTGIARTLDMIRSQLSSLIENQPPQTFPRSPTEMHAAEEKRRRLGHSIGLIRKVLRGEDQPKLIRRAAHRRSKLDPYKPMIKRLLLEDKFTAVLVLEEIRKLAAAARTLLRHPWAALRALPNTLMYYNTIGHSGPPGTQPTSGSLPGSGDCWKQVAPRDRTHPIAERVAGLLVLCPKTVQPNPSVGGGFAPGLTYFSESSSRRGSFVHSVDCPPNPEPYFSR